MGTTVWIDDETRQELRRLQDAFGTPSVNATIRRLIEKPTLDAHTIFTRHKTAVSAILRRHHLRNLVAFGSRARGEATPTSDLDLAAEFDADASPLALLSAEADLEEELGVKVNLVELPNERLSEAIRRDGVPFAA
ncbi:MAG: nucleotidyltransferase family protein [Thermoplasmatota archaeon]